jgi:protein O-GlcNAc transferase
MSASLSDLFTQAIAHERRGDIASARALYERALALSPGHPGALLKLAVFAQAAGDLAAARAGLERALAAARRQRIGTAPVLLAQGELFRAVGEPDAARAAYTAALAEAPRLAGARAGLGLIALAAGDSVAAAREFDAALALEPANAGLALLLGQVQKGRGRLADADAAFAAATRAAPGSVDAWLARGGFAMEVELAAPVAPGAAGSAAARIGADALAGNAPDRLDVAIDAFARAEALAPTSALVVAQHAMALRYACAWRDSGAAEARLAALGATAGNAAADRSFAMSPLMAAALLDDPDLQRAAIANWARASLPAAATPAGATAVTTAGAADAAAPAVVARRGDRLRIGYLSSDFHDHATAYLTAGVFERHDRRRVETFAYAFDRDDGGAMRRRLVAAFDHFADVRALPDAEVAARIAADGLDLLVDLKGHTHGARFGILARRPAPRQIHWLGFPGTLAHEAIDALVADPVIVPPGAERHYAEAVLRMPVCYQPNDRDRPLPPAPARSSVGLPERGAVLACFNQTYKLTPPFLDAWLDALAAHGDAVLWLTVPHARAQANLRAAASARGVAAERLVFAPHVAQPAHIARLRCADLALDVLPYGSHTSGSDALWAGVPLLTCLGGTFAGRVGASLAAAAGLPSYVTDSVAAYRARLAELLARRDELAAARAHLERERLALPLFDTETFTRDFERLLDAAA